MSDHDEDFRRVHERLDEMVRAQSQIREDVAAIRPVCKICRTTVDEHQRILRGSNGLPGLVTEVTGLKDARKRRERRQQTVATGLAAGVAAIISGIASLFKWFSG